MRVLVCCAIWFLLQANAKFTDQELDPDDYYVESLLEPEDRRYDDQNANENCATSSCKRLEQSILSKMDKAVDPCHDMYMYSCGTMIKEGKKQKPERASSTFSELITTETSKLIKIVEGLKGRKENDAYKKVYDWYSACKNIELKKKLGARPLLNVLQAAGSWPLLDKDWNWKSWDLEGTLAYLFRNLSISPLFTVTLDNDSRNMSGSPYGLAITSPDLALSSTDFYLKKTRYSDKILFAYYMLLYKLTKLIGGEHYTSSSENWKLFIDRVIFNFKYFSGLHKDIMDVVLFEMNLAKVKSLHKATYLVSPTTTLGRIQKVFGKKTFDWKRFILLLYKDIPNQRPFTDDEVIYLPEPKVFQATMLLLETTSTRTIANYIMSKVLFTWSATLSPDFRKPFLEFYTAAYGIKTFRPIKWRCIQSVRKDLVFATTALFVKDNLPEKSLREAESLVNRLKEAFLDHLDQDVDWMDDKTRKAAKKKVKKMMPQVGYPRKIRNMTVLNNMYKKIKVDPKKYFENLLVLNQEQVRIELSERGNLPKRNRWDMDLTTANAQYSPSHNKITVAAGLLQPPLFSHDYPRAWTYGCMGMAIGHEMTHGFDAYGSRFDEKGDVHHWWTDVTRNTFKKKTKCMVKQYSKFKVFTEHLNGKQTLDENIADNGGLRIAYEAYSNSLQDDGTDKRLPGINLTTKQLFFLSYGQLWCKHRPKASAINALHTDVHSPAKARVNLVLQNMKEFSDAFKCTAGSRMNPKDKCIIW